MPFSPRLLRFARPLLLGLTILATLVAAIVVIENWRGRRAWRLYAEQQAARGVDLVTLPSPSALPAALNFMRTPALERIFAGAKGHAEQQAFSGQYGLKKRSGPSGAGWMEGKALELEECVYALAPSPKNKPGEVPVAPRQETAERLLVLQQPVAELLGELRAAARERPQSQFVRPQAMDTHNPFNDAITPYFYYVREIVTAQVWHASAALATGRQEIAFEDTLAALKMLRGLEEAPDALLVDSMIGTTGTGLVMQAVWEGLQSRHWSDAQLAALAAELARADLVRSLERSLHTERVAANLSLDQLGWRDSPIKRALKESRSNEVAWLAYFPSGWIQQNKKAANQWLDRVAKVLAAPATPDLAARVQQLGKVQAGFGKPWSPYRYWAITTVTAYDVIVPMVLHRQNMLQLALTACALERYRLAHGRYPERLTDLVPAFLDQVPVAVIDGQPLRYQPDDPTGRFALYSIGFDGKDDGGRSSQASQLKNRGNVNIATNSGDWVWPQPADTAQF